MSYEIETDFSIKENELIDLDSVEDIEETEEETETDFVFIEESSKLISF